MTDYFITMNKNSDTYSGPNCPKCRSSMLHMFECPLCGITMSHQALSIIRKNLIPAICTVIAVIATCTAINFITTIIAKAITN